MVYTNILSVFSIFKGLYYLMLNYFFFFLGNWAEAKLISEISGPIALEFGTQTYVTAMDNGLFTLGSPHNEGQYSKVNKQ